MGDIIFARPRHAYQSYADFWQLVTLAGYPIVYIDEIDPGADHCYIFTTPDTYWEDGWPHAKANIIYWAMEWYLDRDYARIPGVTVWAADAWYARQIEARYTPVGSDARLRNGDAEPLDQLYDIITLAAPSDHRLVAWSLLQQARLTTAPNSWGEARDRALRQSRAMVHIHQHANAPTVSPQRFALAAAYRLPLFTELLADGGIFTPGFIFQAALPYLGRLLRLWLHDPKQTARLRDMGDALHALLCEQHTFRSIVEAAV